MSKPAKLGLITTGQGPRNEYVRYHRDLMRQLGVDVEIKIRNAMDGLSREEIRAIESKPGDRYIASHVHEPGATGDRMGPGWGSVYTRSTPLIPLFQQCLDSLEAEGVSATILCCVEEYPIDAFHSKCPLVVPWLVVTEWIRISTMYMAKPKIGILIPDEEHREENVATWSSQPWMKRLETVFEPRKGRLNEAIARLREENVDLAIYWGYGLGIAPKDPPDMLKSIYEVLGVPFITPQRFAVLHIRNLLVPSLDDRRFVGHVANQPGSPPEI